MLTFVATIVVMIVGIVLIAVRILLKPGGEFHGTCSSRNANLPGGGDSGRCACGRKPVEECPNRDNPNHRHESHAE